MPLRRCGTVLAAVLALFCAGGGLRAQGTRLADVGPYLMDRAEEVALARSAAPFELGAEAAVWVLTREGYVQADAGTNGFECFVGRGWSGPILVGAGARRRLHPDVFDSELRAPHCFNAAGARTVLPWHRARTDALLRGVPAEEVDAGLLEALADGRLALPATGAMAYMMSPRQDLGPDFGPWRPHVMVFLPYVDNASWGVPGFTHDFPFVAESGSPWSVAVIPMRVFADGSEAPASVAGRASGSS